MHHLLLPVNNFFRSFFRKAFQHPAPPCPVELSQSRCASGNINGPHLNDERPSDDDLSKENLGIGLLSHTKVCSIMGDEELDCRVRNGIGYTLFSMDTKEIWKMYN